MAHVQQGIYPCHAWAHLPIAGDSLSGMQRDGATGASRSGLTFSGSGFCCSPGLTSEMPRVRCRKRTDAISAFRLATLSISSTSERPRKSAA
eukprot:118578-Chlamydomonas_euryale.AAC.9